MRIDFARIDLEGVDLARIDLVGVDFMRIDLVAPNRRQRVQKMRSENLGTKGRGT